jgi:HEAT repeat protein
LLDDSEPLIRNDAAEWLGRTRYLPGADAFRHGLMSDGDSLTRVFAAEALGYLHPASPETVTTLQDAMQWDRAYLVRAYAGAALGYLGISDSAALISARLAKERNPSVRASLFDALSRLGNERAIDSLFRLLTRTRDGEAKGAILSILGHQWTDIPALRPAIDAGHTKLAVTHPNLIPDLDRWFNEEVLPNV